MSTQFAVPEPRRWPVPVAIGLAVLLVLVIGWRATHDDELRVGDRVSEQTLDDETTLGRFTGLLPLGTASIAAETSRTMGPYGDETSAPAGATFMRVRWSSSPNGPTPPVWPSATAQQRRDPTATLTLVTGGERYRLADAVSFIDQDTRTATLVIKGDGQDAKFETSFAGRTFVAAAGESTDVGLAQDFASDKCGDEPDDFYATVTCRVLAYRGAYVPGLGAAPQGKDWFVVHGSVSRDDKWPIGDFRGTGSAYYTSSRQATVTIAVAGVASPQVSGPDARSGETVQIAQRAFLVPSDQKVTMTMRYQLPATLDRKASTTPGAPQTLVVKQEATFTHAPLVLR